MYKKIKNSSFMNLIWFLLATLPFVLLLIYAIGFFNNEDLRANEQDNYTLTLNSIDGSTLKTIENQFNNTNLYENISTQTNYRIVNNIIRENDTTKPFLYKATIKSIGNNYILIHNIEQKELIIKINADDITYTITNNDTNEWIYFNTYDYTKTIQYLWNKTFNNSTLEIRATKNQTIQATIFINQENLITSEEITEYQKYNNFDNQNYIMNSCPISYTYNNNTYNIETNSNNYLGTNETLEINQKFNYTLNEQPTLNYNNYNINYKIISSTSIITPEIAQNYEYIRLQNAYWNPTIQYYFYDGNETTLYNIDPNLLQPIEDVIGEPLTEENFIDWYDLSYILIGYNQSNITQEYYNIESTINTSLELIPNNNFNDFLTNINNTIQTNGFISNAFINLSTLFGVQNVYYSLACYYIEYLLIIILLHLAFDVLYIVPNICHKFMEKIGGERD